LRNAAIVRYGISIRATSSLKFEPSDVPMPVHLGSAVLSAAAILLASTPAFAADPAGLWLTQEKDAKIRIAKCGKDTFCGTITWLKEPIDPKTGKPQVDDKNKNPELQNRKIMGLRIFSMALEETGKWAGKIYNADDGNEYDASIKVPEKDKLEVRGCVGAFCGSEIWTKTK
jgi:uncharacterized protein (DUF2147 family)